MSGLIDSANALGGLQGVGELFGENSEKSLALTNALGSVEHRNGLGTAFRPWAWVPQWSVSSYR